MIILGWGLVRGLILLMLGERYKLYTIEQTQKDAYIIRLKVYGHYDQHDISITTQPEDDFTNLLKNFLHKRLTKRN